MNENITLGEAFSHCFGTTSYWVYVAIGIIVFLVGAFGLKKSYDKEGWSAGKSFVLFLLLGILLTSILLRPTDIAANTTKEQAARGVYIGY
jgi:energy-coupling factor transporter transmembrane protein EcfT